MSELDHLTDADVQKLREVADGIKAATTEVDTIEWAQKFAADTRASWALFASVSLSEGHKDQSDWWLSWSAKLAPYANHPDKAANLLNYMRQTHLHSVRARSIRDSAHGTVIRNFLTGAPPDAAAESLDMLIEEHGD